MGIAGVKDGRISSLTIIHASYTLKIEHESHELTRIFFLFNSIAMKNNRVGCV